MKVLIVSQYYLPENVHIAPSLARCLAEQGHQVRVLTGYPNYPEGRLFEGHSQRWRTREREGQVDVLRVPLWIDHSQSALRRTLNYGSFGLSAATARSFAKGADVIYVYATQMTPALAPWLWRPVGGAPYVLHVQDLWPDSITGSSLVGGGGAGRAVDRLLAPWLSSVYRRASAVIGIAPTMVETLVQRGVDPSRVHLVYNWAEEDSVPAADKTGATPEPARFTNVLYGGNVGDMQDLETAVRAAHAASDVGVRLQIVGDGVALSRIRALADQLGATNIEFHGRVPRASMNAFYGEADYALVTLKDLPAFRGTVPSKLQASLSQGLPVITTVQGDVRALVDDLAIGYTADAESVPSLEQAFRAAAANAGNKRSAMASRARLAYTSRFSQAAGIAAIESILEQASRTRQQREQRTNERAARASA